MLAPVGRWADESALGRSLGGSELLGAGVQRLPIRELWAGLLDVVRNPPLLAGHGLMGARVQQGAGGDRVLERGFHAALPDLDLEIHVAVGHGGELQLSVAGLVL